VGVNGSLGFCPSGERERERRGERREKPVREKERETYEIERGERRENTLKMRKERENLKMGYLSNL
jgi:hypothetical protein